jgi:hypothetical protein
MNTITIRHLFISPGHNFFGHHGEEAAKNPLHEVDEIECVAGHGVRGDRFFNYRLPSFRAKFSRMFAVRWAQMFPQPAPLGAMSLQKERT